LLHFFRSLLLKTPGCLTTNTPPVTKSEEQLSGPHGYAKSGQLQVKQDWEFQEILVHGQWELQDQARSSKMLLLRPPRCRVHPVRVARRSNKPRCRGHLVRVARRSNKPRCRGETTTNDMWKWMEPDHQHFKLSFCV